MIIGKPAPFVSAFVAAVDDAIRTQQPSCGMSAMQHTWLAFCVTAVLVTNSICWARFARASLGTYSLAALSWMFAEWSVKGKPSLLGALSGCIAGLVAVTPAAGFAGPMGAIVLGLIVGVVCLFFCSTVKNMFGYDDALDVFGIHCVGGIVGAIGTGILVNPALGGAGIMDYTTGKIADYDFVAQLTSQCWGVATTLVWSGVGSAILYKVVDVIVGLRQRDIEVGRWSFLITKALTQDHADVFERSDRDLNAAEYDLSGTNRSDVGRISNSQLELPVCSLEWKHQGVA